MTLRLVRWLYARLGRNYFLAYLAFELASALTIALATVGIFSLYQTLTDAQFWRIVVFSWGCVLLALFVGAKKVRRSAGPLADWMGGDARDAAAADEAWRTAIGVPLEFVTRQWWQPFVFVVLPVSVFIPIECHLPALSGLIVALGATVSVVYAAVLHFFGSELALRPVLEEISAALPPGFSGEGAGVPLRWKLLGALPMINVVTGVVVSGLSAHDRGKIDQLGLDVAVAVLVAFTISLELTLLVTRSVMSGVRDLSEVTDRVRAGDLSARAPIVSGDELGDLARNVNSMLDGLQERERLREALGSYVAPDMAERVIEEGTTLEGEEVEVTVMFVDICDFTAFAQTASARETVAYLNEFFGLVVPILTRHRGHANKFIGDGVLAVFGAPERLRGHADHALAAACDIALAVEHRWGGEMRLGIGINSGAVSTGSVGGGGRLDFTVIGDAVNVAARVEHATRELGDTVLLTEATRCLLERRDIPLDSRGEIELRGVGEPVPIWAPDLDAMRGGGAAGGDGLRAPAPGDPLARS